MTRCKSLVGSHRSPVFVSPSGLSASLRFVLILAFALVAPQLAGAANAATVGSVLNRLTTAASMESPQLGGLLGICLAVGAVLAIDRRRRIRTPRSTA